MSEERFVIAIDDSPASERAVRYAAGHIGKLERASVCLLAVTREAIDRGHGKDPDDWRATVLESTAPLFERMTGLLVAGGVDSGRIEQETYLPNLAENVPDALLHALAQRNVHTVVVGRNRDGYLHEIFHRHVAEEIVAQSGLNVWVVA